MVHQSLIQFFLELPISQFKAVFEEIAGLQAIFQTSDLQEAKLDWNKCERKSKEIFVAFQQYKDNGFNNSQFRYWNTFLQDIVPVLRDLTRSHREGNWELHLPAVRHALPLCFAFDMINYKRWLPLYYEDCLALKETFPVIYSSFISGGFVVKQTLKGGSGVHMDQALEKAYNKPAKGPSGIIGGSRKKESVVCKWTLLYTKKVSVVIF